MVAGVRLDKNKIILCDGVELVNKDNVSMNGGEYPPCMIHSII